MLCKKIIITFIMGLSICNTSLGQIISESTGDTNADFMRSNEKIYVVMGVVIIIVLGLFVYLFNLDRKMSKMEKEGRQKP